jgi:hypothetical protein
MNNAFFLAITFFAAVTFKHLSWFCLFRENIHVLPSSEFLLSVLGFQSRFRYFEAHAIGILP